MHGFGGHYTDTWTSEGVYWPRDFLKSKLERARIVSFAYDADISQFLPQDDDSVSPCAMELLTNLTKLRADECQVRRLLLIHDITIHIHHDFICLQRVRALIFVVHSIGSFVVKNVSSESYLTISLLIHSFLLSGSFPFSLSTIRSRRCSSGLQRSCILRSSSQGNFTRKLRSNCGQGCSTGPAVSRD